MVIARASQSAFKGGIVVVTRFWSLTISAVMSVINSKGPAVIPQLPPLVAASVGVHTIANVGSGSPAPVVGALELSETGYFFA